MVTNERTNEYLGTTFFGESDEIWPPVEWRVVVRTTVKVSQFSAEGERERDRVIERKRVSENG